METNWIQYKCRSGQTLLVYNKKTGQFKWPSDKSLSGENSTTVMLGEPVFTKELCTTATQTDDVGCINGCTSMYISTSHLSADMGLVTRSHMENGNRFNKDSVEATRHIQTFHNYTIPTQTDDKAISESILYNKETSQEMPDVVDEVANTLDIESGIDNGRINAITIDMDKMINCYEESDGKIFNNDVDNNVTSIQSCQEQLQDQSVKHFKCDRCGVTFISNSLLEDHIARMHPKEKSFECSYCKKKLRSKKNLKKHLRIFHLTVPTQTGENPGYTSSDYSQHNIETITHYALKQLQEHGVKRFKCSHCEDAFICNSLLENHVARMHSKEKPFECPNCKHKFVSKKNLKKHVKSFHHTTPTQVEENLLECSYCKKKLKTKKYLEDHIRTHTGEKPFELAKYIEDIVMANEEYLF
ncbi:Zinc finger protein 560 [Exaiptasia diaphana]|nr:Zinc finger protein 560 [Exaiptasia diaphana]